MITNFERVLRRTNLEIWTITIAAKSFTIFIEDMRRAAHQSDFDSPVYIEDLRANIVIATVVSTHCTEQADVKELVDFVHNVTNHVALAHCNVVVRFEQTTEPLSAYFAEKLGDNEAEIPLDVLRHLHQEI